MIATLRLFFLALFLSASTAGAQSTALFDGQTLDGWVVEHTADDNVSVRDGVLRVEGPGGWLRSERRYGDFSLRVEFRFMTDDADSGIFLRVDGEGTFARGWPAGSYQVQTRDVSVNQTTSPRLIGDIYRHRMPDGDTAYDVDAAFDAFRPTGEWQAFEIAVFGDSLTVRLNGTLITRAGGIANEAGFIGLQGETGLVEYRSIELDER